LKRKLKARPRRDRKKAISSAACSRFFRPCATFRRPRAIAQLALRRSWPETVVTTVVEQPGPPDAPKEMSGGNCAA